MIAHRRLSGRLTNFAGAVMLALLPGAVLADGEYWGIDVSGSTTDGVLSAVRGQYTFGAGVTDSGDGASAGLSLSRHIPYDFGIEGLSLSAGPALGFSGDNLSEVEVGVGASVQRYVGTDWGSYFLQASVSTVDRAFFVQVQSTFAEPSLTVGLARGGSTEYDETTLSLSKQLPESPVSLRAGYRFHADEWFVGFSVNTF